jgi:hypothetical protein
MAERKSWPELVGQSAEDAKAAILKEDPSLHVFVVPSGSAVTADFR